MTALVALRCEGCGGAVAAEAGASLPRCLFCGRDALTEEVFDEAIERPEGYLPFEVDAAEAEQAFRSFAASSIWYPSDLRRAKLKLERLFLPAWRFSGEVESHWAALVPAATRSGKRPESGAERARVEDLLVPASPALTRAELAAIAPFPAHGERPLEEVPPAPYELGDLTRRVAEARAAEAMTARRHQELEAALPAVRLRSSHLVGELAGRPLLLPVWIGAYRHKDTLYRVVVNGRTAALHGKAPLSGLKIAAAVVAGLVVIGVVLGLLAAS